MEFIADTFFKDETSEPQRKHITVDVMAQPPKNAFDEALKHLQNCIGIQEKDGNWDYDHYMCGLMNGLIMARSCMTGEPPRFKDMPSKWGYENEIGRDDSLVECLSKVCDEYMKEHAGEIGKLPSSILINIDNGTNISATFDIKFDIKTETIEIKDAPQSQSKHCDKCFAPLYAEQENPNIGEMYPDYLG